MTYFTYFGVGLASNSIDNSKRLGASLFDVGYNSVTNVVLLALLAQVMGQEFFIEVLELQYYVATIAQIAMFGGGLFLFSRSASSHGDASSMLVGLTMTSLAISTIMYAGYVILFGSQVYGYCLMALCGFRLLYSQTDLCRNFLMGKGDWETILRLRLIQGVLFCLFLILFFVSESPSFLLILFAFDLAIFSAVFWLKKVNSGFRFSKSFSVMSRGLQEVNANRRDLLGFAQQHLSIVLYHKLEVIIFALSAFQTGSGDFLVKLRLFDVFNTLNQALIVFILRYSKNVNGTVLASIAFLTMSGLVIISVSFFHVVWVILDIESLPDLLKSDWVLWSLPFVFLSSLLHRKLNMMSVPHKILIVGFVAILLVKFIAYTAYDDAIRVGGVIFFVANLALAVYFAIVLAWYKRSEGQSVEVEA